MMKPSIQLEPIPQTDCKRNALYMKKGDVLQHVER